MRARGVLALGGLAGLLWLGGCSGGARATDAARAPVEQRRARGYDAETVAPLDDEGGDLEHDEPLTADPYGERAGGPDDPAPRPAPPLRFADADPRPLEPGLRPALPGGLSLALVAVRDGCLVEAGELLLELESALSDVEQVGRVVALQVSPADVGADGVASLEELAAVAEDLERDLVLIDLRHEGDDGGELWLVHAASAELALRVRRDAEPASSDPQDAYERIALAALTLD